MASRDNLVMLPDYDEVDELPGTGSRRWNAGGLRSELREVEPDYDSLPRGYLQLARLPPYSTVDVDAKPDYDLSVDQDPSLDYDDPEPGLVRVPTSGAPYEEESPDYDVINETENRDAIGSDEEYERTSGEREETVSGANGGNGDFGRSSSAAGSMGNITQITLLADEFTSGPAAHSAVAEAEFDDERLSVRTLDVGTLRRRWPNSARRREPIVLSMLTEVEKMDKKVEEKNYSDLDMRKFTFFLDAKKRECLSKQEKTSDKRGKRKVKKWKNFKSKVKDFLSNFTLWRAAFKNIEGHFGESVLTYFRFIKWLLLMNLLTTIIILSCIVLPQAFLAPKTFEESVNCQFETDATSTSSSTSRPTEISEVVYTTSYFEEAFNWTTSDDLAANLTDKDNFSLDLMRPVTTDADQTSPPITKTFSTDANYHAYEFPTSSYWSTSHPETDVTTGNRTLDVDGLTQACNCSKQYESSIELIVERAWWQILLDILQGTEWMEVTVVFIGHYFNKSDYLMSLAFLFTTASYFIFILILIVNYIASNIRSTIGGRSGVNKYQYAETVFGTWDHLLTNEKAAKRKMKQFYNNIIADLEKDLERLQFQQMSRLKKVLIFFSRIVVLVIVVSLLVAAAAFIYFLIQVWIPELENNKNDIENGTLKEVYNLFLQYLPSISLTFLNILFPLIYRQILRLTFFAKERYFLTFLVLAVFTRLASVTFLIITIFIKINNSCSGSQSNECCTDIPCWETYIGQYLYSLVIMDFLLMLLEGLVLDFLQRCVMRKKKKETEGKFEFDLAQNVLDVVYTQTICWLGVFFSPFISVMTVVKLFLLFYVKKLTLFYNCVPSSKTERSSRFHFFFMVILLISLCLCYGIVTYAIGWMHPSRGCGPFRVYAEVNYYMYRSFSFVILDWSDTLRRFVYFIFSWMFVLIVSVVSIFIILFYDIMANRNRDIVRKYEEQILLETKDKEYMLRKVQEAFFRNQFNLDNH